MKSTRPVLHTDAEPQAATACNAGCLTPGFRKAAPLRGLAAVLVSIVSLAGCDNPPETWPGDDSWKLPEWNPDPDAGADADADSDADTETDTGIDTEGYVACDAEPSDCEEIGDDEDSQYYGCCFDDAVYWCQEYGGDWLMVWKDCGELGLDCAYLDDQGFLWCV